jgi:hypothetical protein
MQLDHQDQAPAFDMEQNFDFLDDMDNMDKFDAPKSCNDSLNHSSTKSASSASEIKGNYDNRNDN